MVAYSGISQKTIGTTQQSDLIEAKKQLELYKLDNGSYPSLMTETSEGSGNYCFYIHQSQNIV